MISASVGIINVTSSTAKRTRFPRKEYFANPYPANGQKTIVIAPLPTSTIAVLRKQRPIGMVSIIER